MLGVDTGRKASEVSSLVAKMLEKIIMSRQPDDSEFKCVAGVADSLHIKAEDEKSSVTLLPEVHSLIRTVASGSSLTSRWITSAGKSALNA